MANIPSKNNVTDVLAALKEEFATSVNNVYINSLNATYGFRDITVLEQKTFSKLLIDHENEPDFIYDAQCALIQKLALDETFDIYKLTEFDRLKIFFLIYQANFFAHTFETECPYCNSKFSYSIDFETLIKTIDDFDISDIEVSHIIKNRKYDFVINFPTVKRMQDYKKYQTFQLRKNKNVQQPSAVTMLDMIDLLIKRFTITNLDTNKEIVVDTDGVKYTDYIKYLETLPQNVLYSENSPIISAAKDKFAQIKAALPKIKCNECGESIEIIGDIDSFFI